MPKPPRLLPNENLLGTARALRGMVGAPEARAGRAPAPEPAGMAFACANGQAEDGFATTPEGVYPPAQRRERRNRLSHPDVLASMFLNERPTERPRMLTENQARWLQRNVRGMGGDAQNAEGEWLTPDDQPQGRWRLGLPRNVGVGYRARLMFPLAAQLDNLQVGTARDIEHELNYRAARATVNAETLALVGAANAAQTMVAELPRMTAEQAEERAAQIAETAHGITQELRAARDARRGGIDLEIRERPATVDLPPDSDQGGGTVTVAGVPAEVMAMAALGAVAMALAARKSAVDTLADIRRIVGG